MTDFSLQGGPRGKRKSIPTAKKLSRNLSCLPRRQSARLVGKNLVKMVDSDNMSDESERSEDTQYDVSEHDELQSGDEDKNKVIILVTQFS